MLNKLKDESGQAAVEYILILVVVVTMILGGIYQLNSAFKVFADNYFGDYLACLIETGELPSFDGGASGECNQLYKPFSLADGRPMVGDALTGNEGAPGSDDENSSANKNKHGSNDDGGGTVVAQTNFNDSSGSGGGSRRFRAPRAGGLGDDSSANGSKTGTDGATDLSGYESGSVIRIPIRRAERIAGGYSDEDEKEEKKKTKVTIQETDDQNKKGPERIKVDRRLANDIAAPELDDFSFGKLLRLLIIAAIIIAIVIFIGGQIMQVSKSMD